jgi:hypothetical protein
MVDHLPLHSSLHSNQIRGEGSHDQIQGPDINFHTTPSLWTSTRDEDKDEDEELEERDLVGENHDETLFLAFFFFFFFFAGMSCVVAMEGVLAMGCTSGRNEEGDGDGGRLGRGCNDKIKSFVPSII